MPKKIAAIILDGDKSTWDSGLLPDVYLRPVLQEAEDAGIPRHLRESVREALLHAGMADALTRLGASERQVRRIIGAFKELPPPPNLRTYGDELALRLLRHAPHDRLLFLVTTGIKENQWRKIIRLDIERFFDKVYVDDEEDTARLGKEGIIGLILEQNGLDPGEVMVGGDRHDRELKAGKKHGTITFQTTRMGVKKCKPCEADYFVDDYWQLLARVRRLEAT